MSMGNLFKTLFRSGETGTVIVNGKEYRGSSISISGDNHGQIIIDGVAVSEGVCVAGPISITVHGDVDSLSTVSGDVEVYGNCGSVASTSGSVSCGVVQGDVTTVSGSIRCADVGGNVRSVSGSIKR